ncbi:hypothetical protein FOYG_04573 [Fusarium oxysporum NRRL 32931]|uniref:Uncharacterized protein n=1 Tax=Fusarium oxysporum NRRL 32931 TaxID=660029 RepID=W9IS48_FUSOX|nr:hypothetical protein FOYG_04573 [Fusarium oxysporum NRRL 32931]EWY95560.1 hypothetical protein FOYG_04573 [Fusarium oxysporum NRRL 32931]
MFCFILRETQSVVENPYLTLPLCLPVFVFLQHGDIQHWANYRFCLCCILPFEFKRNWFHCFELKPVSPPRVRSKCLDDRGSIRNCPFRHRLKLLSIVFGP